MARQTGGNALGTFHSTAKCSELGSELAKAMRKRPTPTVSHSLQMPISSFSPWRLRGALKDSRMIISCFTFCCLIEIQRQNSTRHNRLGRSCDEMQFCMREVMVFQQGSRLKKSPNNSVLPPQNCVSSSYNPSNLIPGDSSSYLKSSLLEIISKQQVPRSKAVTASVCGKSLADFGQQRPGKTDR